MTKYSNAVGTDELQEKRPEANIIKFWNEKTIAGALEIRNKASLWSITAQNNDQSRMVIAILWDRKQVFCCGFANDFWLRFVLTRAWKASRRIENASCRKQFQNSIHSENLTNCPSSFSHNFGDHEFDPERNKSTLNRKWSRTAPVELIGRCAVLETLTKPWSLSTRTHC